MPLHFYRRYILNTELPYAVPSEHLIHEIDKAAYTDTRGIQSCERLVGFIRDFHFIIHANSAEYGVEEDCFAFDNIIWSLFYRVNPF